MTYQQFYLEQREIARHLNKEERAIKMLLIANSNWEATDLYRHYHEEIPVEVLRKTLLDLERYFYMNEPVQYLIGYAYFYGLKIMVNKNVLIPRPETELLIDEVLKRISTDRSLKIIDLGTGSGAIALALKKHLPQAEVLAVDISSKALELATENASLNNLEVHFLRSDLFANVRGPFDILVSNPPYISRNEVIECIVHDNEPHLALYAEKQGLYFYEEIFKNVSSFLKDSYLIALEIPENHDESLVQLIRNYLPNSHFEILKDFNEKSRILLISHLWR
jgi:release factor glutamine methyltransferase